VVENGSGVATKRTLRPDTLLAHRRKMATSIWEYLWLRAHITAEESDGNGGSVGIVANGEPIPTIRIAGKLQCSRETTLANLDRLEGGNYITRSGAPGQAYRYRVRIIDPASCK